MHRLAIAGVGLIGGSFALALREAGIEVHVTGIDLGRNLSAARERGVIDAVAPLEAACSQADVVYVALPIRQILGILPQIATACPSSCIVTDAGSTKREIVSCAARVFREAQFLGGHPMAGKETRGVTVAEGGLFRGRPYLLTPQKPEEIDTPQARLLLSWIEAIQALPEVMTPEQHDATVALTSHLPQLLSTTLSGLLDQHPDRARLVGAAGPGLIDSTRLALSPWGVWADIISTNRVAIDAALQEHAARLELIRAALDHPEELQEHFASGRRFSEDLRNSKS